MKRKEAIKAITKVLKNWEDCRLTDKTSKEVLIALESYVITKEKLNKLIDKSEGDIDFLQFLLKE